MKIPVVILAFFFFATSFAQSGEGPVLNNRLGVKGGMNLAILSQSFYGEQHFKPGMVFGFYFQGKLANNISLQPEILLSSQGARFTYYSPVGSTEGKINTNLMYVNIPLMLKAYFGQSFHIKFGPQAGIMLSAKDKGWLMAYGPVFPSPHDPYYSRKIKVKENVKSNFNEFDFSLGAGLGYDFPMGLNVSISMNLGLSDVLSNPSIRRYTGSKTLNRVIQFAVGYSFGGKN